MADNADCKMEMGEKKIPVFSVLKNGSILKNIFLLNNPPSISEPSPIGPDANREKSNQENDEILLVGRHPDCNIMLEHPSVSRFHLRIHSQPSLQELSVVDLSSAHGTWVSGKKIEPQVLVELNEGDTLRLGASTRIYKLHWLPLIRAFDMMNPFVPPSALAPLDVIEEEISQDNGSMSFVNKQIPSEPPVLETLNSSFPDENSVPVVNQCIPLEPPTLEVLSSLFHDENSISVNKQAPLEPPVLDSLNSLFLDEISAPFIENQAPSAPPMPEFMNSSCPEEVQSVGEMLEGENQSPTWKPLQQDSLSFWSEPRVTESVNSSLPVDVVLSETLEEQIDKENQSPQVLCVREVLADTENKEIPLGKSEKKCPSIWSRRGKPSSALQIQTGRNIRKTVLSCTGDGIEPENQNENKNTSPSTAFFSGLDGEEEIFTPDKENLTPNTLALKAMKKGRLEEIRHPKLSESLLEKITSSSKIDGKEDTLFSSDKENITPKVLRERTSGRLASGNRAKLANMMKIKRKEERAPFQCLLANSSSKSLTEDTVLNAATRSSNSVNCSHSMWKKINPSPKDQSLGDAKKRWYMVVDTTSLLNKESRKSLQLLQGLKGTQLIIPRMVIRELDCMKRRGSLFRRATEVSSVLEWIEDCMVKTKWWIHVQNSVEGMPIAPTPPASPGSQLSEGSNGGSVPFSSFGSLMEIVSPTAEDHILDCTLLFKRIKNDGQLVLLTNDVTLKIKAMAEGLICETAEEFRESLVNPYSERFLWVDSTPRGPTWSCSDDVVLKEKYYRLPMKKTSKPAESARGLKLILFHNSHYGQIDSVN